MNSPWLELLANLALVAMFVSIWAYAHEWTIRSSLVRAIAFGLLMALGAVTLMQVPAELFPGTIVDLRATMIALAGFFGGPLSGVIAGGCAIAYRILEGGVGVSGGIVSIALTTVVGIAGNMLVRGREVRRSDIVILGAVASIAGLGGFAVLPREISEAVLPKVALPSTLLVFTSTVMSGFVLLQENLRVEALRSKRLYQAVVQALPDCLNVKDLDGRFLAANPATASLMQAPDADALIGKTDFDFYPEETAKRFRDDELAAMEAGTALALEQEVSFSDGGSGWLSTLKAPMRDQFGVVTGLITHNRDITGRKALERDLAESQLKLNDALKHMADGLVMFDADGVIALCNEQYRNLFPQTADLRIPGARHRDILLAAVARGEAAPDDVDRWIAEVLAAQHTDSEREVHLADGRWLDARTRQMANGGSLSVFSDITTVKRAQRELVAANEKLKLLANRDGLTELMTRRAFDETLQHEFKRSKRSGSPLSLLLLDVDWFKRYNDRYGHPAGDECLRAISRCLRNKVRRPADSAARYGGEELAAILPDTDADGAFVIGEAVLNAVRALHKPHEASEYGVVTASIGVATFGGSGDQTSMAELLRRADQALYGAKAAGRNRVHGWRPRLVEADREAEKRG